ncbi:MAG: serine hydrolase domain-containing protein [Bacteroidales bacterium]
MGLDKGSGLLPDTGWLDSVPSMDEITVRRMLLTHTSDLPRYVMNAALWDTVAAYPGKVWSYHDRLSFIFNEPAVHEAGSGWSYSDSNYILIGMLIEQITGRALL